MTSRAALPESINVGFRPGEVALVGAGPGDPGLLTLRAWGLMAQAQAVVYDRLVSAEVLDMLPPDCDRHYIGKACGHHMLSQDGINALLLRLARQGLRVLRLKGGDPFVFGRGGEEVEYLLKRGVSCQVVPGITAAIGCTAYAGIPLTHRDLAQSCQFITGHRKKNGSLDLPWQSLANAAHTLVFYMGLGNLQEISDELIAAGMSPEMPVALIDSGASRRQRVARGDLLGLAGIAAEYDLASPTLVVIGKVVKLLEDVAVSYPARLQATDVLSKEAACA